MLPPAIPSRLREGSLLLTWREQGSEDTTTTTTTKIPTTTKVPTTTTKVPTLSSKVQTRAALLSAARQESST